MLPGAWKNDITDLMDRARSVTDAPANDTSTMSARTAAACLSGIVGLVSRRFGVDAMQRTCAELVRYQTAWSTSFGLLPIGHDGEVSESTQLVAVVARSLLPLAGAANLRDALAFWAIESDPAVWNRIAA